MEASSASRVRARPRKQVSNLLSSALLLILVFLTAYPIVMLIYGSLRTAAPGLPGSFALDGYREAFTDGAALSAWKNSFILAAVTTVLSSLIAIFFAFVAARTDVALRRLVTPMMAFGLMVPSVSVALAWSLLGAPRVGLLNVALDNLHAGLGFDIHSWAGLIVVMTITHVPLAYLLLIGAFQAMDKSFEEAAQVSGAGRWETLIKIDVPLVSPALLGVMILTFIKCLHSLEVPLFIGFPARIYVFSTSIFDFLNTSFPPKYAGAAALSVVIVLPLIPLVFVQSRLLKDRDFATITGKNFRPERWHLGRVGTVINLVIFVYFFVAVVLPAAQILLGSLFRVYGIYSWSSLTWDNYTEALQEPLVITGAKNTVVLAGAGGFLAMVLAVGVAYIVARSKYQFRKAMDFASWLPWTLPGVVTGTAILWAYVSVPGLRQIYGTPWLLLIGVVVTVVPVSVRLMVASLIQISRELEEAAWVHRASWIETFFAIILPLLRKPFLTGWLVIAILIAGELAVPILLYAPGSEVLSIAIYQLNASARPEVASAVLCMFLLAIGAALMLARVGAFAVQRARAPRAKR